MEGRTYHSHSDTLAGSGAAVLAAPVAAAPVEGALVAVALVVAR